MFFDQSLSWKKHIQNLKLKCQRDLNLMRTISSKMWGADSTTLTKIYRSIIRSKLDYGAIIYNSAKRHIIKQLDAIQNNAVRIVLGAFYTNPVDSILCELGEPDLYRRRMYLTLSYAASVAAIPEKPVHRNVFANRFRNMFQLHPRLDPPYHERLYSYQSKLNISLPLTYNLCYKPSFPPWCFISPSCDSSMTEFSKSTMNHSTIR